MLRRKLRIRMWLIFAVSTVSLVITSSAYAVRPGADYGRALAPQPAPTASAPGGFSWLDAGLIAAVTLAVVAACVGIVYVTRSRRRLALSH